MAADTDIKTANAGSEKNIYDRHTLPDFDTEFISQKDLDEFEKALAAPEGTAVVALNDWRPVRQKVKKAKTRGKRPKRSKDETREGFVYTILKYPFLVIVFGWIVVLGFSYLLTRLYIYLYEHFVTWTGRRERIRTKLNSSSTHDEWVKAAKELDKYLGNEKWKHEDEYAYYDHATVRKVKAQLVTLRRRVEEEGHASPNGTGGQRAIDELRSLLEACMKNNFVGVENPRLYSETYYGTKGLVQDFVDECRQCLETLYNSNQITNDEKRIFFKHLDTNYGRTALCLSGGATFAYYHFGVIKALLETGNLPEIITGTSGGALIAALVATRTDEELGQCLVPALAYRITACKDGLATWGRRWWRTGARFDSLEWARQCSWFCRGSMTFREAYERTGRILNVSCVPSDPHSPTILTNYLTSPDCVIWSAVLASAAVPGILNPVVLMMKTRTGTLAPYSFGHKWKDGSLRTDIPLKALNLHFNVNFSIVSQVNPHINLFFFSSRGTVGRPVTHRRGRGWRGGFLGSAAETSLKLDLQKYLKILRHLELLPRPLGQDWSEIWLQRFSGTITIWPKSIISDFFEILSDPSPRRLARMLRTGELSAWPKLVFLGNRMKIERMITKGLRGDNPEMRTGEAPPNYVSQQQDADVNGQRGRSKANAERLHLSSTAAGKTLFSSHRSPSSIVEELKRQSTVFFDDSIDEDATTEDDEGSMEDDVTSAITGEEQGTRIG